MSPCFLKFSARLRKFIDSSKAESAVPLEQLFQELALELFSLQFEYNPAYRTLCQARGISPRTVTHWKEIPAIPTATFKELDVSCLPVEERTTAFHSSGTTAHRPSRHFHNADSLAIYEASVLAWFFRCVPGESRWAKGNGQTFFASPWQIAILTPPPAQAPHSSLVHMFDTIRRALGRPVGAFLGRVEADGGWTIDSDTSFAALKTLAAQQQPALVLGTAFSFVQLLDDLALRDRSVELPTGSLAMETGGYKGRSRELPKTELHSLIQKRMGIAGANIFCEYGMSELSSQAYQRLSSFHFPPWARAQIISPETGREVADGETGLIRIFDLANVYSVMAIQTEDLGIRRGAGFELLGRAALSEARGCSLMAV